MIQKILFALEPEVAHDLVKGINFLLPKTVLSRLTQVVSPCLKTFIGLTSLDNPIGLAAGFDKNAELIEFARALGFGFTEIGSMTARACQGNPKPRIFRLPLDRSLINRMGLPNQGIDQITKRIQHQKTKFPIGLNIVKTPGAEKKHEISGIDDIVESFQKTYALGAYTVINLSCPNTQDGRTFEEPGRFLDLVRAIHDVRKSDDHFRPCLVKLSPDVKKGDLIKIVDATLKYNLNGFVISNTSTTRHGLKTSAQKIADIGLGGLSGEGLKHHSNRLLKEVYEIVEKKMILIGCGGIMSFKDLIEKLSLGASFFQVYTGLIYEGPFFIRSLNRQLKSFCKKMGVTNYKELVGKTDLVKALNE